MSKIRRTINNNDSTRTTQNNSIDKEGSIVNCEGSNFDKEELPNIKAQKYDDDNEIKSLRKK